MSPVIRCTYGPYFKTDPEEQKNIVAMTQAALGKGIQGGGEQLIPKRCAIEKLAPIFGLENLDAIEDSIEEEKQEAQDKEHQRAMELQHSLAKTLKNGDSGSGVGAGGKPNPPKGGGGASPVGALAKPGQK